MGPLGFFVSIQMWTLGAIHQERKAAIVPFVTMPCFIIFNLLLMPYFKEIGVAISSNLQALFLLLFY